ncbi:hypothetical protein RF55_18514, partial [Lasius niger]
MNKIDLQKKDYSDHEEIVDVLISSVSDFNVRNHIDRNRNNDETDTSKKDCDYEQMTQTKNCIYRGKANVSSECNKPIDCVDDNRNKNKTDTQNSDCDYLVKTDIPIVCDCVDDNINENKTDTQNGDCDYLGKPDIPIFCV